MVAHQQDRQSRTCTLPKLVQAMDSGAATYLGGLLDPQSLHCAYLCGNAAAGRQLGRPERESEQRALELVLHVAAKCAEGLELVCVLLQQRTPAEPSVRRNECAAGM